MDKKEYALYKPIFEMHWRTFCDRFGIEDKKMPTVLSTLLKHYAGKGRHYHSIVHIVKLIEELRRLRKEQPAWFLDPVEDAAIELAIWFHDVIYDTSKHDNEEQSAQLAEAYALRLGFSRAVGQRAKDYVRATDHKQFAKDFGAQLVCDVDLLSLALPPTAFDENTRLIRLEYQQYTDEEWRQGRLAWGESFLDPNKRPSIYQTEYYRNREETYARANLARMVEDLRAI